MKTVSTLLIICSASYGCSTSYSVSPLQGGGDYSYNDLTSEFEGKEADIMLKDGREIWGSQIRVNVDSLYWNDPASSKHYWREPGGSKHYAVAVNVVQRIARTNHLIGALKGLGFGIVGAVFVFASSNRGGMDDPSFAFTFIGTLASPPLGLIVGSIVGHPYEYVFPIDSTNAKQKQR